MSEQHSKGGISRLRQRAKSAMRTRLGRGSALEKSVRSARNIVKYHAGAPISRRDFYAVRNGGGSRLGVFGLGGCDLNTLTKAGPALARAHPGSLCVVSTGKAAQSHSSLVVQTLDPPSPDVTGEVAERLSLHPDYFSPRLFEPTFAIDHQAGVGLYPKSVVVLSVSADTARTLYRHREHGFLVDPGGWWLTTDLSAVLQGQSAAKWFTSTFEKVGRIPVENSMRNLETIITAVRRRLGSLVVVFNVLTVDPGVTATDYKFANSPNRTRRREFVLALGDLSRQMEFPILDVDRLAKQEGISGQADFVHYTNAQKRAIAADFVDILAHHRVVGGGAGR